MTMGEEGKRSRVLSTLFTCSPDLLAPALDGVGHEAVGASLFLPLAREGGGVALRTLGLRQIVEADPHRQHDALAHPHGLLIAQRRQRAQHAFRALRQGPAHEVLVLLVAHAQREQGAALGENGLRQLRGALRHQAEGEPILAALLGDARDDAAGRLEAVAALVGNVAVRLLADQQHRHRGVALAPYREVEQRAAEQRDDDRSEEHTSELQSLMRNSYAVFCLKKQTKTKKTNNNK